MPRLVRLGPAFALCMSLFLEGCDSDNDNEDKGASGQTDFTTFVQQVLDDSADSEPRKINDLEFSFSDDPGAFNHRL